MLSPTEIHYVAGFLYLVCGGEVTVILGEKVRDSASESDRDVDIVIATAGQTCFAGIEVKQEGRPLDVITVEGICQKLADMPIITSKAIVSASGYTAPAKKKAAHHGVDCLRIVRGPIPSFGTIDLSQLKGITRIDTQWLEGPSVVLLPEVDLTPEEHATLNPATPVKYLDGTPVDGVRDAKELADRIASKATAGWRGPEATDATPVTIDVTIDDAPHLQVGDRSVRVRGARVAGVARRLETNVGFHDACYLEDASGKPLAAAGLVDLNGCLVGFSVAAASREFRVFTIPEPVRVTRPIRHPLSERRPAG